MKLASLNNSAPTLRNNPLHRHKTGSYAGTSVASTRKPAKFLSKPVTLRRTLKICASDETKIGTEKRKQFPLLAKLPESPGKSTQESEKLSAASASTGPEESAQSSDPLEALNRVKDPDALQALADKVDILDEERMKVRQQLAVIEATYREAVKAKLNLQGTFIAEESVDYGYTRQAAGEYRDVDETGAPRNMFIMGKANFEREFEAFKKACLRATGQLQDLEEEEMEETCEIDWDGEEAEACKGRRRKLRQLTLDDDAIWDRERARPEIIAPWVIKAPYFVLCYALDMLFANRPIQRFWFLETVARMPYFSYNTMLYVYETLGWWRRSSELRKVHFAEEWNEYHHLLIMESLGGDRAWRDRFLAQHSAILYYWILVIMWVFSPTLAYNFSELIEAHAVDTYAQFADENEELLMTMAPPRVAREYYQAPDLYLFDEFQTARPAHSRRPKVDNLHDVFCNIRDDEAEHVKTMAACQDEEALLRSPNTVAAGTAAIAAFATVNVILQSLADNPEALPEGLQQVVETLDADGLLEIVQGVLSLLG
mmetsp:Transcript_43051/g.52220  ORF Transcript_43051/g.52220 Transcript_43051/m.52220 type:complete len:542 (+) Transcript_43051:242-1867(+)|eukprot:CAMPEP_0197855436 /NCGR_PEP_ID=MMETSP1438-20131217/26647_1 /TAXON_ID=1461541 /ORGANISM="Pterosperma sp., Strain CCMP1384" /LENGTH=541 /DNA_ID=CAMNT_0043470545 /DNA_START=220 /DNA_END=1845 /DNA_ORIENTATION=-